MKPSAPVDHRSWLALATVHARWVLRTTWRNGEQLLLVVGIPVIALLALTRTDLLSSTAAPLAVVSAMIVLGSGFTSPAISIAFERRYGSYAFLGTTPMPRSAIIAGTIGSIVVSALLASAVVGAVAPVVAPASNQPPWQDSLRRSCSDSSRSCRGPSSSLEPLGPRQS